MFRVGWDIPIWKFEEGNVTIINNAIELDNYKYNETIRKKIRRNLDIKKDTLVMGHIGRFIPQKNHLFLIDIFYELHQKEPNSILILIGKGPLVEKVLAKVKKLKIENAVKYLGQINNANELYQAFDVFVLPSLYEGLPVVGIEAQTAGNLCFLSDTITPNTKIIDSTIFMNIDSSPKMWAEKILENANGYKKINRYREVSKSGFNIKIESKKLEKKYTEFSDTKRKMRIFFNVMDLSKGGAERVVNILTNEFIKKHDVKILTNIKNSQEYIFDEKIEIECLEKKKSSKIIRKLRRFSFIKIIKTYNIVRKYNPNIIICFLPEPSIRMMLVHKLFKKINAPIIISERNDPNSEYQNRFFYFAMKSLFKDANGFVFQTKDAKLFFDDIISCSSTIINNPLNDNVEKKEINRAIITKEIVSVGRLEKQKNFELLLRAYSIFVKNNPDYKLIIYGDGREKDNLLKSIREKNLDDKVYLAGQVDNIQDKIANAALFVLSSNYEGMPNALIEAMALGIPCVSTDCPCGGPKELIEPNESGLLVPTNNEIELCNAMEKVVRDEVLARKISENAIKIREKCSKNQIIEKWYAFIRKVMNEEK